MKKLQNNFTTPEQSKRLLELGLPADSADCYHNRIAEKPFILSMPYSYSNWDDKDNPPLPCWSVGRLMEIMKICAKPKEQATMVEEMLYCDDLAELLVYMIEENKQVIEFSKLED